MYLHAGAGTVVRGEDIIGIFDLDGKITTADTAAFLRRAEKDHVAELAGDDLPKCFLVCLIPWRGLGERHLPTPARRTRLQILL